MPFKLKKYQKEYQKKLRAERKKQGLCYRCGYRKVINGITSCRKCRIQFLALSKLKQAKDKRICIEEYGRNSGCVCCGIKQICFLTIDHIKDDGFKNRVKQGLGKHLYRWLIKNNFPKGFQVLCFNCQWGKRLNGGFCPHHPMVDLRRPQ